MSNNDQTPEKAQWVYDASNMEELSERYDQWAQDYDCDMINVFGSVGAQRTVEVFIKLTESFPHNPVSFTMVKDDLGVDPLTVNSLDNESLHPSALVTNKVVRYLSDLVTSTRAF